MNLSQEQLAEIAHTDQKRISKYEHSQSDATGDTLAALATALGTSTDYLLGLTDDPTPNFQDNDLAPKERKTITAWRLGYLAEAAKIILNG